MVDASFVHGLWHPYYGRGQNPRTVLEAKIQFQTIENRLNVQLKKTTA